MREGPSCGRGWGGYNRAASGERPTRRHRPWRRACIPHVAEAESALHTDLERLQGTWVSEAGRREAELMVAGRLFTFRYKGGEVYMGAFWLDPTQAPRAMDMRIDEGPGKHRGKVASCVYEIDGERLAGARHRAGDDCRPADGTSHAGRPALSRRWCSGGPKRLRRAGSVSDRRWGRRRKTSPVADAPGSPSPVADAPGSPSPVADAPGSPVGLGHVHSFILLSRTGEVPFPPGRRRGTIQPSQSSDSCRAPPSRERGAARPVRPDSSCPTGKVRRI